MLGIRFVCLAVLTLAPLLGAGPRAASMPRFETAPCPKTPEPIEALKHAQCGFLIVPENRSSRTARPIRLQVAIVRSLSKPALRDPIVFMAGGPGEAAILDTPFLVRAGINRNRDVIIMDQRGTLYDDPDLNCPELDRYYARQVSLVYDAPSTARAQAAAAAACHRRLVNNGVDLSAYNTTENEADFVDLRRALGIRQWNVYGYSYGTDLALSLMRDHPGGIRTAIIDSVVPPDIVGLTWTWGSMREGMSTIFRDCQAQPTCARKYPNLLQTFTRLVVQLEAHPLIRNVAPAHGGPAVKVVLDGGTLVNMIAANRPNPSDMPAAIVALAHGDPRIFLQARAAAAHVAAVPEQAQGMTQSIVCREWEPYGSPADILRAGKREFPALPDSVLINAVQMPFEHELCQAWNVPAGPASQRIAVRSTIPTLVVSGTIDGKTGARWGRYQTSLLANSTHVRINAVGHWVIVQSPCAQQIFQSFLTQPRSPNTSCAPNTPGVKFKVAVATAADPPAFVPGPCPSPPHAIAELKRARCGQLIVPESRERAGGKTIRLAVAIVPASSAHKKPDPIIWLAGGPGDDAITEIPMALAGKLNANRDVIFMSQRGTYTAQPKLTCAPVDRWAAQTLDMPYDSAATGRAYSIATLKCRREVLARTRDLGAYNTLESADDLDDLRVALHIAKWNVYGISYGTDLALTYMREHPGGIRSAGIDGVFPPSLGGGAGAWKSAGEGINAVFSACREQSACRQRYGDIGATFRRLVLRYEASPKTVTVKVPGRPGTVKVKISGGMLVQWAVSPGTHIAAKLPSSFDALAHGDPAPIASTWAAPKLDPAGIGVLSNGLFSGVSCGEWVPYETEQSVIDAGRRAFPMFPVSILKNAPNLPFMRENCRVWNVPKVSPVVRAVTRSSIPTLVISAQYDAQTAPSFGPYVARTLTNATVVTIPNVAHVAFGSPSAAANACAYAIVRSFFDRPNRADTSCIKRVPATNFAISPRR